MHTGDALVENQGVGDDGAGHAAGLRNVSHPQQPGNGGRNVGTLRRHLLQYVCRPVNTAFQGRRRFVHGALGHGNQANQVGQVGNPALQPTRFRETGAVFVEDTMGQPGRRQGRGRVVCRANAFGVAQGNGGFHGADFAADVKPQPLAGVGFRVVGFVFGLDDHRGATGGGDQHVGVPPRVAGDGLGTLGADSVAGQHGPEQSGQGGVGGAFDLVGSHIGLSSLHPWGRRNCITLPAGAQAGLRSGVAPGWSQRWVLPPRQA